MIEIHNVTKYYGRVRALHDVSFDVPQGEVVGLLGPNGSGKTTLMRILTGFFPPTSGQVRVGGLSLSDAPLQVRDQIGYLPENVVLYPDMSVRAFLRFCARVKLGNAMERLAEVARVLTQCRLEDVAGRRIGALSKGYRQRVGLAQALLGAPRVLILDEPTVGLDPHQVIEMRALIKGLAGETTVLLSSHILSEVGLTCQRVVIIDKGRIIAQDRPDSLDALVQGTTRTFVRLRAPHAADLTEALRALPGVSEVVPSDGHAAESAGAASTDAAPDDGRAFVLVSRDRSVAREIAQAVVERGWDLVELRPVTLSLEELFVRLTGESQAA